MLRLWISILTCLLLLACTAPPEPMQLLPSHPWHESKGGAHRGTVLLVHGLNNRPEVMQPLAERLADEGYDACVVTLTGHESSGAWPDVDYEAAWLGDFSRAVESAKARFPDQPLFGIGYSLGATVITRSLADHPELQLSGLVLISPAWPLTLRSRLIRAFVPFDVLGMSLPSFAPPAYRAHNRTSLRAYRGLFRLADSVNEGMEGDASRRLRATKTLCAISPDDRLVSYSGMEDWLAKHKLPDWTLEALHPAPQDSSLPAHLVLDEESLGHEEWEHFTRLIFELFARDTRR
ncbi:MAG: alpha/beta fold hydrolase [Bdellovibrionota bacterium]